MKIVYGQDLVNELRKKADGIKHRLWIAVPYIGGLATVRRIIGRKWIENTSIAVRLLTDANEFNNFNSETIRIFEARGKIRHLVGLHAKIYIADDSCLITSANLTNTAFTKRHEIGIFLDEHHSKKTIALFEKWWNSSEVVSLERLAPYLREATISIEEETGFDLPSLWTLPVEPREINYWFKPIGSKEDPIDEDRIFSQSKANLHFADVEPKGVKIDDLLIGYGVGAKRILSIYKVLSIPIRMTEAEITESGMRRWPWYVKAKNLTPTFGKEWSTHNIYASSLVADFLRQYPNGFITKVEGRTLGALRWGADKINLNSDFARFVVKRIEDLDTLT